MAADRYVLLGLARAQAQWFLNVANWSVSAALPVEFLKAITVEELRARLDSRRAFSALLIDGALSGCDRDLVEMAAERGCAVIVIDDRDPPRPWLDLGAAAVLRSTFEQGELLSTLQAVACPVARTEAVLAGSGPSTEATGPAGAPTWRGRLVAVTGAGGAGRSTLAMALATGLARDPRDHGSVVLADLALQAQQGVLHDAGDVVPGVCELVDAHRTGVMGPEGLRQLCFQVGPLGYDLLLGLRRRRDWVRLRAHAFDAALDGLRRSYRLVVADVDADVEGQDDCGVVDLEDRNMLARTTLRAADLVLAVGLPGLTGVHSHIRVLHDLVELGVPTARLQAVVNRAPRGARARAELSQALTRLLDTTAGGATLPTSPVFVPDRRRLDELLRDGGRPPPALTQVLAGSVRALLDQLPRAEHDRPQSAGTPELVSPGSLGSWSALGEEVSL